MATKCSSERKAALGLAQTVEEETWLTCMKARAFPRRQSRSIIVQPTRS